ncbi:phosphocholine cytidylyltransferase family protein [Lichenicola cladoniae]|uniref:Phosphocholine cytidylyltransferase family protein n=1 Tax=Lichenicola cladoniae TaxID=1484109 RepID=A0A6M8HJY9_9PROT|nr:phosphocholine cytidylyltransferase family protein [Lichenicola cladoniae]NPD68625.1 phosphocholine cytidylyltransferase family protein [Acetobacteraceae bacterium]QKE88906.1 phosphocholine cytidylyltransferase family protein [Lichenicola cladoniae]
MSLRPHAWAPPPVLILAAGRGRRLSGTDGPASGIPKILLPFGGRTLLQRHLERLAQAGAGPVHLVVGYQAHLIEAELERLGRRDSVTLIHNPDWHEGSIVSLDAGRAVVENGGPVVLMDADVLYGQAMIERLFGSTHPAVLLLDREIEPGDEPVRICVDADGRIVDFAKQPDAPHLWYGESVGFFRFSADIAASLALRVHATVSGGGRMIEYEEPIRALIRDDASRAGASASPMFGFEDVSGLPWTEIDFMEDVVKAEALLPLLDGGAA